MSKTETNGPSRTDKVLAQIGKLGTQRHLSAIRDAFALYTPLLIAGAVGIVLLTFVFGGYGTTKVSILGWCANAAGSIQHGAATVPTDFYAASTTVIGAKAHAISLIFTGKSITGFTAGTTLADLTKQGTGITLAAASTGATSTDVVAAAIAPWNNVGAWNLIAGTAAAKVSAIAVAMFGAMWGAVMNYMSIYFVFGFGYFIARSRQSDDEVMAGLTAVAAFLIVTAGDGQASLVGANGLMCAIIVGALATELFVILSKSKKLLLKMPAGVPPAVARAFAKLFPIMIIFLIAATLSLPFILIGTFTQFGEFKSLGDAIFYGAQSPFITLASSKSGSLGLAIVYVFLISFFWFFGLHGTNIVNGVFNAIWLALLNTNVFHGGHLAFVQGSFDAFVFIGGWAATLSLLLATLLFSKVKSQREISKFALPAGIFQINEPVTFGYPLVLNVTMLFPMLFVMPVLAIITWLAIQVLQWVPPVKVAIPWTSPVIVGGVLATLSWQGAILALFNLAVSFAMYIPFVFLANKQAKKEGQELVDVNFLSNIKSMFTRKSKRVAK